MAASVPGAQGDPSDLWIAGDDGGATEGDPFLQTVALASSYETVVATILNAEMTASGYTAGDQIGVPVEFTLTSPGEIIGIRVSGMGGYEALGAYLYEAEPTGAPGDDGAAVPGASPTVIPNPDLFTAGVGLSGFPGGVAVARASDTSGDWSPKGTRYVGETFWLLLTTQADISTPPAGDVDLTVWVKHS